MADISEMRIFSSEQIDVHRDLPMILKNYSKEVIRNGPENIAKFSREYFENILKKQGYFEEPAGDKKEVLEASESRFIWRERTAKITDHYKLTDALSEGSGSKTARIAIHKLSGIERGILQKNCKAGSVEREQLRKRILDLVARFDHKAIVKLIEVFEDEANVYIVTEALKGDNIMENMWKQSSIHEGMAAKVLQQVLAGIRYIHGKGVAHNQLNPTNIHHINTGP